MPLSMRFPDEIRLPAEVPILAVQPQQWNPQSVTELARRFEVDATPVDTGLWMIARGERAVLEVYQATASFRYSRLDLDGEGREGVKQALTADEARRLADTWIEPLMPEGGRPEVHSVTEHEVLVAERSSRAPRAVGVGLDVNYRFTLEGYALLGPGAKAKVAVHPTGVVASAYRFWRDTAVRGSVRTLPVERMFERFAASALFSNLSDSTARAEVGSVRFGYLCLPPTETMSILVPALEVRGTISTEAQPRYDYVTYVAATELGQRDAKQARLINARPALLVA